MSETQGRLMRKGVKTEGPQEGHKARLLEKRSSVLSGLGIGVLADWLIREDIASGRLVRVLPQWNAKELAVHVVYPGHRMLPVRVRVFVDFAVPYMASEVASKS